MAEYKLSYTASEIDEKLGKIDENTANISKLSEDIADLKENGTGSGGEFYVGSDTPPEKATIWIDPTGEPTSTEEWEFDMDDGTTEKKTVVVVS